MEHELIVVKQLPVIEEQLQKIKTAVIEKVNQAKNLVCTEETVKAVKTVRASLNKEFAELEEKRKQVKSQIMTPYEQFEEVYKDCVSNLYKEADKELKDKIDSVENELKEIKAQAIKDFFNEYRASLGIDPELVSFEDSEIRITLSASEKSLKEAVSKYLDKIVDDLKLINTQEHQDEIMFEYRNSLNVSLAITTVSERYKAIERAKAAREAAAAKAVEEQAAIEKVIDAAEEFSAPAVEEIKQAENILTVSFKVYGTKEELIALKKFLVENHYHYE